MSDKPKVVLDTSFGYRRWAIVPPCGYVLRGFFISRTGDYSFGTTQSITMDIARKHVQRGNFVKVRK